MWKFFSTTSLTTFVLTTGETRSVRELVEAAFGRLERRIVWQGNGVDERGIDAGTGKIVVEIDPTYFRPTEVDLLVGDASKARDELGWQPTVTFKELVTEMIDADLDLLRRHPRGHDPAARSNAAE